jgi:hypothetical protein
MLAVIPLLINLALVGVQLLRRLNRGMREIVQIVKVAACLRRRR